MKICTYCNNNRPSDNFHKDKNKPDGLQAWCKGCRSAYAKEYRVKNREERLAYEANYRARNPEAIWAAELKYKFGITPEDYNRMYTSQGGACAICKDECSTGTRLAVDHCHKTDEVRGLLCNKCNRGLGYLGDSLDNLKSAVEYLSPQEPQQSTSDLQGLNFPDREDSDILILKT